MDATEHERLRNTAAAIHRRGPFPTDKCDLDVCGYWCDADADTAVEALLPEWDAERKRLQTVLNAYKATAGAHERALEALKRTCPNIAAQAIGLYQEYEAHGYDPEAATAAALNETRDGTEAAARPGELRRL